MSIDTFSPVESSRRVPGRGHLKIFLGFAPGVGKTFAMLDEAHRRRRRGQDVVVGYVESHERAETRREIGDLEVVAPKENDLDTETLLQRHPSVVLVDELEGSNQPGQASDERWQKVVVLLNAGINVITTLNVHSLESLKDQLSDIAGITIPGALPDSVMVEADEIELVDLTPRALLNRIERGDLFAGGATPAWMTPFLQEGNLMALREIAMREAAGRVDEDVTEARKDRGVEKPWATNDRVMICVSPSRNSLRLIRKGWRMARRLHGEAVVIHVDSGRSSDEETRILEEDFALAARLGLNTVRLKGNVSDQLIQYARAHNITQILLGHPDRTRVSGMLKPWLVNELARALHTVDIMLVAAEKSPDSN